MIMVNPGRVVHNPIAIYIQENFGIQGTNNMIIFIGSLIAGLIILKNIYSILIMYWQNKIISKWALEVKEKMLNLVLYSPYETDLAEGDANKIAKANAYLDRKNKGRADDEKFASVQDIYDKTMVGSARKDTSSSIGAAGLLAKRAATNVAGETKKTVSPIFKQFESVALDNPFVQGFGGDSKDGIKRMFNALTMYDEKRAKEEKEKKEAREKREKEIKEEAEIRRELKAKGYLD